MSSERCIVHLVICEYTLASLQAQLCLVYVYTNVTILLAFGINMDT